MHGVNAAAPDMVRYTRAAAMKPARHRVAFATACPTFAEADAVCHPNATAAGHSS